MAPNMLGGPDPNSKRRRNIRKQEKAVKRATRAGKLGKCNGEKGGSRDTVEAPPTVQEFSVTHSLDSEICALAGLCLCLPVIIEPAKRLRNPFWKVIRKPLLEIRDRNVLTSEVIMSKNLLSVLQGNFLEKGVRKLVEWLSELSGKTAGAAVKKPQCFRL